MTRKYSSTSVSTTLQSALADGVTTSMTVSSGTGNALLGAVTLAAGNVDQFSVAIDADTANEEIVFITAQNTADQFTIVRGRAGTSAVSHTAGATVKHVMTSDDLNYFTTAADTAVTLTGTQTLTNKTIAAASNTLTGVVTPTSTDTLTNKTLTTPVATVGFNAQTGTTYTFVLGDASKFVTCSNASAIAVSIPTNASVAFATGTIINVQQIGAGQVTIAAATPGTTTVTSAGTTSASPKTRAQHAAVSCIKTGTDTWTVVGDLV
jgi:hypothetical protein